VPTLISARNRREEVIADEVNGLPLFEYGVDEPLVCLARLVLVRVRVRVRVGVRVRLRLRVGVGVRVRVRVVVRAG
tara:strand:+ start:108 stop:335 length:228 start_codon:yes stop_codon:yes gene_type:complete